MASDGVAPPSAPKREKMPALPPGGSSTLRRPFLALARETEREDRKELDGISVAIKLVHIVVLKVVDFFVAKAILELRFPHCIGRFWTSVTSS